jgi:hypothetical protein
MTAEENREGWEAPVSAMIAGAEGSERLMRSMCGLLAKLLDADRLPESGRAFVAELLRAIERGENPLPRKRKPKTGVAAHHVALRVAQEMVRLQPEHGDKERAYERVARQLALKTSTVRKMASIGRSQIRRELARHVKKGGEERVFYESLAAIGDLSADNAKYFFQPHRIGNK